MGLYLSKMTASRNTAIRYLTNQPVLRPHRIPPAAKDKLGGFFSLNNTTTDSINGYTCSLTDGTVNATWANNPKVDNCVKTTDDGAMVAFPTPDNAPGLNLTGTKCSFGLDFYHGDDNDNGDSLERVMPCIPSDYVISLCYVVETGQLRLVLWEDGSTYHSYYSSKTIRSFRFYRLLFTFDGGVVCMYFNGEQDQGVSNPDGQCPQIRDITSDGLVLGWRDTTQAINMLAANVCFYPNYCLSPWEAAQNASYEYFTGTQSSPALRYV